jgi:hypothetical protein
MFGAASKLMDVTVWEQACFLWHQMPLRRRQEH